MDHSAHLVIDHGGHSGHGGHDGNDSTCTMHSSLTWSYKDTCVVFSSWHIRKRTDLVLSMVIIGILAYFYEYFKYYIYKFQLNQGSPTATTATNANSSIQRRYRLINSIAYGFQVGFSFMLMLVFMTYNGWLMISVVVGAIWGNYHWGSKVKTSGVQQLSCH